MLDWQKHKNLRLFIRIICVILILTFLSYDLSWAGTTQRVFAQTVTLNLPSYTLRANNPSFTESTNPLHLRYLYYDPGNQDFKVLLDKGNSQTILSHLIKKEAKNLITYFLIGLTLPNSSFWANLRPDSPDNIIDDYLAQTDLGKILLEADLHLKEDVARLTSPVTPEGKVYWDKLYKKAGQIFGYDNVTIPTLTRPWIVPDEIIVRDSGNSLYIYKATLKVMLEQDYLKDSATYNFRDERLRQLNEYSSQLIRELIIPKLTKEINSSRRYAQLRQVYYSLIFAQWFKGAYSGKDDIYSSLIDRRNLTNIALKEKWSKDTYFQAYQKSFKNGEYDIQKLLYTPYGQTIRSYFSGGIAFQNIQMVSSPATVPVVEAPDYTVLASVNGNPTNLTVVVNSTQAEPETVKETPYSQQLADLFRTQYSDEQIRTQALGILGPALSKEGLDNISQNTMVKALQVARRLYLRPDTKSEYMVQQFGITRDELLEIYRLLRTSDTLQGIIIDEMKITSASGFVEYTIKKLLRYGYKLERLFNRQVIYPVIVEWHPGEFCNSNCIFCFNKGCSYQGREIGRVPLTPERVREILNELAENDVREFWVSGGKEPLVNPIAPYAIQYATDLGLAVQFYTNGIKMSKSVQEKILGCRQIRISLNAATPETYRQVQGINGDNFNLVVKNIGDLVKLKRERGSQANIGISFLLTEFNYKEILKITDIAKSLGVDFLAIQAEQVGTIRRFTQEEAGEILNSLETIRLNKKNGVYGNMVVNARSLKAENFESEKRYYPNMESAKTCQVRMIKIGMNPYGVCYLCEYAEQPRNARKELEIGDANKMSFREIVKSSLNIKHNVTDCQGCTINEYGMNIALEKLKADKDFGIPLEEQPYRVTRENEIPYKVSYGKGNGVSPVKTSAPDSSQKGVSSPSREEYSSKVGGIDFRRLPITSQAIKGLNMEDAKIAEFDIKNFANDLKEMENLINAGVTPSEERIKDCFKTVQHSDDIYSKRLQRCIIDTLRLQEKNCDPTEELLKDILSFLEQNNRPSAETYSFK